MLSRRDRAACSLALECLRLHTSREEADDAIESAQQALSLPLWEDADRMPNVIRQPLLRVRNASFDVLGGDRFDRLLRARLALYLRALLRADADDCGVARTTCCGRHLPAHHYPRGDGFSTWRGLRCLSHSRPYE